MRKILYTSDYGAGWSSWHRVPARFSAQYQPIIDALEKGEDLMGKITNKYASDIKDEDYHPAVVQFLKDCKEMYGIERECILGLEHLSVEEVGENCGVKITCHDGKETVNVSYDEWF